MSKQFAGNFRDDSDSMDSSADDHSMVKSAYISPYGTAVLRWKPRKLSAKRDFPKAFDEVTTHEHLSVSNDELQNISGTGFGVSQFPKRRKVAVVRDFPVGMTQVVSDDLVPFEKDTVSSGSSINGELPGSDYEETDMDVLIDKVFRDLADESTKLVSDDLVPSEMDSVTSESSIHKEMLSSDYGHTDFDELIKTNKKKINLPYEGANVVSDDLDCVCSGSSINREMPNSDYEDTDLDELIKTDKKAINLPYEGANIVSDDLDSVSDGSSINRERVSSDYEDTDLDKLIKTYKGTIVLPYEGARVVSDDLDFVSSGSSINREILSSDYEDTDLDKLIKTDKRTINLPYEGANVVSDDLDSVSSGCSINRERLGSDYEDSDDKEEERYKDEQRSNVEKAQAEADTLGPCTELKIYGASVTDIRWNQSQGQMQIQLSIDNLQNYSISIKPSGKGSGSKC